MISYTFTFKITTLLVSLSLTLTENQDCWELLKRTCWLAVDSKSYEAGEEYPTQNPKVSVPQTEINVANNTLRELLLGMSLVRSLFDVEISTSTICIASMLNEINYLVTLWFTVSDHETKRKRLSLRNDAGYTDVTERHGTEISL